MELIYRGTRDGMNSNSFHNKCDYKGPTNIKMIKGIFLEDMLLFNGQVMEIIILPLNLLYLL